MTEGRLQTIGRLPNGCADLTMHYNVALAALFGGIVLIFGAVHFRWMASVARRAARG